MANMLAQELAALGERTATGSGQSLDITELRTAAKLKTRITATSGDRAALELRVETSEDNTTWRKAWSCQGNSGAVTVHVGDLSRYVRAAWVFGAGVASASFVVRAEFHQLFASKADLFASELPKEALSGIPDDSIYKALISSSSDCEDILASGWPMPLTTWPESLTERVCALAGFRAMKRRGFQPEGADELVVKGADDALKWFKEVAAGKIRPPGLSPPTRLGPQASSGNPKAPTRFTPRMSDDFGDF
jgi:phage gp36-like protein